ncbi:unnamed protein product [Arctogadus glacialis]
MGIHVHQQYEDWVLCQMIVTGLNRTALRLLTDVPPTPRETACLGSKRGGGDVYLDNNLAQPRQGTPSYPTPPASQEDSSRRVPSAPRAAEPPPPPHAAQPPLRAPHMETETPCLTFNKNGPLERAGGKTSSTLLCLWRLKKSKCRKMLWSNHFLAG